MGQGVGCPICGLSRIEGIFVCVCVCVCVCVGLQ